MKHSSFTSLLISITVIIMALTVNNAQGQTYVLGKPGADDSSARIWDMNNAGKVVGSADVSGSFLWEPDDVSNIDGAIIEDINPPDGIAGGNLVPLARMDPSEQVLAFGISDTGWITGIMLTLPDSQIALWHTGDPTRIATLQTVSSTESI